MVPILAVAATFILRDLTKRGSEVLMADAAIATTTGATPAHGKYGSMSPATGGGRCAGPISSWCCSPAFLPDAAALTCSSPR